VNTIQKIKSFFVSRCRVAKAAFDIRDFFVLAGIGSIFYGVYMVNQWLAFVVCGSIVLLLGFFMRNK
jgi:hypothetical protein